MNMLQILCFLCCVILCKVSDGAASGVYFPHSGSNEQKVQKNCNRYIMQACNGTLTIQPNISIFNPAEFDVTGESSPQVHVENPVRLPILNLTLNSGPNRAMYVQGGNYTKPREYPHMALIGFGEYEEVKWLCGGSLISERYVLSAAHCSSTNEEDAQWVRLGELDLESRTEDAETQDFQIIERIVHPGYKFPSYYNDIALFKLRTTVTFSAFVRPICLNVVRDLEVKRSTGTGWGSTGYGETRSSRLKSVNLDTQDYETCDKIYKGERLKNGFNASTMICAGNPAGGNDTCQMDSGGPLQISFNVGCPNLYLQIGIVSFGQGCGWPDTPAVYTKVSYFIPWIESIVWK